MNSFLRISTIVLTALFGGIISVSYIAGEIITITNRDNMEGYFNPLGMSYVILALTIIGTNIPSIICQVKIMAFNKAITSNDIIDEDASRKYTQAFNKLPSRFLRNANLVFSVCIITNFIYSFVMVALDSGFSFSSGFIFVATICVVLTLCGVLLLLDAIKLRKTIKELLFRLQK